ncbi:MAG: hypothetical protein AABY22_18435, partial [Nanoarchaeota archaeon]
TTNLAALKETVKNGIKMDIDIMTADGQKLYVDELVKLLNDPKRQDEIRKPMMQFAQQQFGWNLVAEKWHSLFKSYLDK